MPLVVHWWKKSCHRLSMKRPAYQHVAISNNRDNADNAQLDPSLFELWREAFVQGKTDEQVIGKYLGDIINKSPSTVSFEERERSVRKRIGNVDWTPQLEITAINAKTGTLESFNETSDISLIEAVMASGGISTCGHIPGTAPLAITASIKLMSLVSLKDSSVPVLALIAVISS